MNSKYVPIGASVQCDSGCAEVYVDPITGSVITTFRSRRGDGTNTAHLDAAAVAEMVVLLGRAAEAAPKIKAAHDVRMRARATAEDTYDRIVNHAVGGAL